MPEFPLSLIVVMKNFFFNTIFLVLFKVFLVVAQTSNNGVYFAKALEADYYHDYIYSTISDGKPSGKKIRIKSGDETNNFWEEFQSGSWIPLKTNVYKTYQDFPSNKKQERSLPSNSTILTKIKLEDGTWFTLNDNEHEFESVPHKGKINAGYLCRYHNYGGGQFPSPDSKSEKWHISSGINGLDLATALINMEKERELVYDVKISNFNRVADQYPDFILTQVSNPPTVGDYIELRDAKNNRIGNRISIIFPQNKIIGFNSFIRYDTEKSKEFPYEKATPLYILYFKLSDFGITRQNYKKVKRLVYSSRINPYFDPAFFAYDKKSLSFEEDTNEYSFCEDVTVSLGVTSHFDNGTGPYDVVYEIKHNNSTSYKTFFADVRGENIRFSENLTFEEPGDYTYKLFSITDKHTGTTLYRGDFQAQTTLIHILPLPEELTDPTISSSSICIGESVNITFKEKGQLNVDYLLKNSSGEIVATLQGDNKTPLQFSFTPTKTDSYTLEYGRKDCTRTLNISNITVKSSLKVFNFSQNVSICKGSVATLTLPNSENGVSYQLVDEQNNNIGTPQIGNGGSIHFSVSTQGKYSVVASSANSCTQNMQGEASVTVIDLTQKLKVLQIQPSPVCQGNSVSMVFEQTTEKGIVYKLVDNTGEIIAQVQGDDKSVLQFQFTPQKNRTYNVEYGTTVGDCVKILNLPNIEVSALPTIFNFSQNVSVCKDETAVLQLQSSQRSITYQLFDSNNTPVGTSVSGTGQAINFETTQQGRYHIIATNLDGCTQTMQGEATVTLLPKTQANTQTIFVCPKNTVQKLQSHLQKIFPASDIELFQNNTLITDMNEAINPDSSYSFTVKNTNQSSCVSDMNNIVVSVIPTQVKTGYIVGKGKTLSLYQGAYSSGVWSSTNSDIVTVNNKGEVSGKEIGKTTITFTDTEGCSTDFEVQVIKICNISIFNYLSPNQDENNDFLYIDGIECFPDNELTLFDREGNAVFRMKGYDNSQNIFNGYANTGENNGQKLPTGVYFAKLDYTLQNNAPSSRIFWIFLHQQYNNY